MKKIGFIGAYDKTDLLLNIAKVLTVMNYRVLVVDSTINQKARYVVPAIDPTVSYITSFEDMDVAVGFNNVLEIQRYIGTTGELPYDILLIDCDTIERVEQFELEKANKNYFVTSFDLYALKKGVEVLKRLSLPVEIMKVYFSNLMSQSEDDYFNYIATGCRVKWNQDKIYFPLLNEDLDVIKENQRLSKIRFKGLSNEYKTSLMEWTQDICGDSNGVKKACRQIERGV